ncbi:helix-turn-helix domain-containing protein [Streptomyces lydicus]|uniref:helix-turn-helix domain-containing protein n=1 Tax=Streptomyces lydicus TaxID=47763 RepID=UPI001010CEB4|nr:helix-turn-helix transcriptional regulator [Streptomyces lydicus]MCZ1012286.1 helix-turn-helix transcriptional regulator [Streptomyces lydicus]
MTDSPALLVGARIWHFRRKNGNRTQATIAGLCGITERYLRMIETGKRTPSSALLARIAAELGVPISALLTQDSPEPGGPPLTTAPDVVRALMGYAPSRSSDVMPPAILRERVEGAWRTWQTSPERYTDIEPILPALVTDVEHAVRGYRVGSDGAARRDVLRTAADLYGLLRSYCRRTGRLDLSLMVADRARRAAEDADDPIRLAAAEWNLGHCLLSRGGGAEEARDVAGFAVEQLQDLPPSAEKSAMQGALELVRVVADAKRRKWWDARERITQQAVPLGAAAGEANIQWTVFGPTNVHLHALSIEMLAGDSTEGLRLADEVDISLLPSRERQFTFTLELARCYDLRRDDAAVLVHLLDLEKLSYEDMARSSLATEMVTGLLHRVRPTYRRQVTALAERLHLT